MPTKIYRAVETPIVFRDSGGDVAITLNNLANNTGRVSARYDRGAGSRSRLHEIKAVIQVNATVVAGVAIEIWLFQSDGTYADGTVGTADAALPTAKRNNGLFIGAVIADQTAATVDMVATFQDVPIASRYYSIGIWNASAVALQATANACRVIVTPMPDEVQ